MIEEKYLCPECKKLWDPEELTYRSGWAVTKATLCSTCYGQVYSLKEIAEQAHRWGGMLNTIADILYQELNIEALVQEELDTGC